MGNNTKTYIYARVSTIDQTVESQVSVLLKQYPDAIVVKETGSGTKHRKAFDKLLGSLQQGDKLVVAALDRLGRSVTHLAQVFDASAKVGFTIIMLREGIIDPKTPHGKMFLTILSSFAEFESAVIRERTRASLKHLKDLGVKLGRPVSIPPQNWEEVKRLRKKGHSFAEIAKATNISKASISRYFAKNKRK